MLRLALDMWLTPAQPESWYSPRLHKDVGSPKGEMGELLVQGNVSRQMLLLNFVFLFGSIPPLFGQRQIIVLGFANIFM